MQIKVILLGLPKSKESPCLPDAVHPRLPIPGAALQCLQVVLTIHSDRLSAVPLSADSFGASGRHGAKVNE